MFINITDSEVSNNKGSSGELVHYLDKEERLFKNVMPEHWFNGTGNEIPSYLVKSSLDSNIAKLCKNEAKFYLVNISPSQKEISHLKGLYGKAAGEKLKEYAVKLMDEYARNFKRDSIRSNKDLMWFAKLESHRYYNYKDQEVKSGRRKAGEIKPGDQMHVQVIVSRKDITNKMKLSPRNNSNGKNAAHSKKMGEFNRVAFKSSGEKLFDQIFGFDRKLEETFRYANVQKSGNLQQKVEVLAEQKIGNTLVQQKGSKGQIKTFEKTQENKAVKTYLPMPAPTSFLEIVLAKADYDPAPSAGKKRKKRKGKQVRQEPQQGI